MDNVDRNVAILDGDKYCAPFCGAGCTLEAYKLATKRADNLAAEMGKEWKPVVWENLGWHSRIERTHCTIYINKNNFWIDLQLPGLGQMETTVEDAVIGYKEFLLAIAVKINTANKALLKL